MSHEINDQWRENAREIFDQAMTDGDMDMAQRVYEDVAANGFVFEAQMMDLELKKKQSEYEYGEQ